MKGPAVIKSEKGKRSVPKRPAREAAEYEVVGATRVFGVAPGGTFTRLLPEAQEARLVASRAIKRAEAKAEKPERCDTCPAPDACAEGCLAIPEKSSAADGVAE